ncbi:MAG: hypothetical protein ACR2RV_15715, partial [Verrucomicrobiales bacterium]
MKIPTPTQKHLAIAQVGLLLLTSSAQAVKLWDDEDPISASIETTEGLTVTNVSTGPAIGASHATAGELDQSTAAQFSSVAPSSGPLAITPDQYGQAFTFSVDYFVPTDTVMDGDDTLYVQLNFNSNALGSLGGNLSAGFIGAAQVGAGWNTIELTGTVPATDDYPAGTPSGPGNPVDTAIASIVFVDGGFAGTPDNAPGVSLYI